MTGFNTNKKRSIILDRNNFERPKVSPVCTFCLHYFYFLSPVKWHKSFFIQYIEMFGVLTVKFFEVILFMLDSTFLSCFGPYT